MCNIWKTFMIKLFGSNKPEEKPQEVKKYLFSKEDLYKINGNMNQKDCDFYYEALNEILPKYGINTKLRVSHFLAQILHESGHLKYKSENLNYSAQALRKTFSKYFPTDEIATKYARQPEKIANRVYANRMGNGDEKSGDGWKHRGRGVLQLTGKTNYINCGRDLGLDLENNPDLVANDSAVSIQVACWFWKKNDLNIYADNDDIKTITKRINGGYIGLDDRMSIYKIAKSVIKMEK